MRFESSVTSVSWIPSEAVSGAFKLPFSFGIAHYDDPPPSELQDPQELVNGDRCRFCNQLRAFIEVEHGRITNHGWLGDAFVGSTTLRLGSAAVTFAPVVFPTLRPEPVVTPTSVKFTQTCGARTGVPAPRPVSRPPFFQWAAPTAWTTLELELYADGSATRQLIGASSFPRHWVYDHERKLFQKSSLIDFDAWGKEHFGDNTPWGAVDSPALVSAVESALEQQLSLTIMRAGTRPKICTLQVGDELCRQGEEGDELFLLLDGLLEVQVDGVPIVDLGPGAVLGERALLEGGRRTSSLVARTRCKVAVASSEQVDREKLAELSLQHRREER